MIRFIKQNLLNIPGWKTRRKIVVFESDDWGSIRTPSRGVSDQLIENGLKPNPYLLYDTLASQDDLEFLFDILLQSTDSHGKHPVITANTVVANPNFERIKEHCFLNYYYEPFTETLKKYYPRQNVWSTWKKGIDEGLFFPQFHGREHLNVPYWLRGLKNKDISLLKAFELGCWSCPIDKHKNINLQASYDTEYIEDLQSHKQSIAEGLRLFEDIFKFRSESFIANNYIWSSELNKITSHNSVKFIQGMKYQKLPRFYGLSKRKMIRHYLGKKNEHDQYYLIRNCVFEPSQKSKGFDSVKYCLSGIQNAFLWNKPAIVSVHRLNFIGSLVSRNRDTNLTKFALLLKEVKKRWPDVEFLNSVDLGRHIHDTQTQN